jgi:hypothetical protein
MQKWESLRDYIYEINVVEDKTLRETMRKMEGNHALKARYVRLTTGRGFECLAFHLGGL